VTAMRKTEKPAGAFAPQAFRGRAIWAKKCYLR
jgi:hypothetical protein